ncbi:MAG: pilus (MSHA type) biogenesis protein MshL [Alphaproteobacteria bacterium]|nr:pilus (MSHA type) biogenesis protein MshL [Alphaproteobacteria bacterium]
MHRYSRLFLLSAVAAIIRAFRFDYLPLEQAHLKKGSFMRFWVLLALLLLPVSACQEMQLDKVDPVMNLDREDYRDLRKERDTDAGPPIPRVPYKTNTAAKNKIANDKIISISITEKVPVKDVLQELASKAEVNLELDPRITGGVIFTAIRQPFSRVLDRLCNMAGLRYTVEDHFLRIELDEPYIRSYPIDYLTLIRKSNSEIGIATNVFSTIQGGNGRTNSNVSGNGDVASGNNSTTKVETQAIADFWGEIESNIEAILTNTRSTRSMRVDGETLKELKQDGISPTKAFAINRQAGLISVFGTQRQQQAVETYLKKIRRNVNSQVLIEARIMEVQLDEDYRSGINWRTLFKGGVNAAARFGTAAAGAPFATASTATDGVVTLSLKDNDFGGILNFVRSFGTSRTLSSPRLTVLNNQPAVLKVARNEVYFTSTIETTPIIGTNGGSPVGVQRTVNSTPNTVPIGFLMTVQPSINEERDEVTLNLRPTVSFIVDRVEDPGVKIAAADANVPEVSSSIPVVAVREMDSVLTLKSGAIAVMGGLMQDSSGNLEQGVPFADEVPIIGNIAKARSNSSQLTELVILLRATVLNNDASKPDEADAELYHKFNHDRRPLPIAMPERIVEAADKEIDGVFVDDAKVPLPEVTEIKPVEILKTDIVNEAGTAVDKPVDKPLAKKAKKAKKNKKKKKHKKMARDT